VLGQTDRPRRAAADRRCSARPLISASAKQLPPKELLGVAKRLLLF